VMSVLHEIAQPELDRLVRELRARWADLIDLSADPHRIYLRAAELDGPVARQFDAPGPGWQAATYISPDVMLAATDVDAINRGDFQVVLGETHLAIASYRSNCFVTQHPAPGELLACIDADTPLPRLLPVLPKEGPRLNVRTHPGLIRDLDYSVALFRNTADPHRPRLLMGGDLPVDDDGAGQLTVRLPDGTATDAVDAFSETLMDLVVDSFKMFEPAAHTPRVNFDRLVVCRETWRFDPAALAFAAEKDEALRYLSARRWQRETGLPLHVFVKSPGEVKPFFVDFDSPIYVNIFCKSVRRLRTAGVSDQIVVSEMMPDLDELWLADADGQRYTCELRMIATKPRPS
jgi:hypothetical protein